VYLGGTQVKRWVSGKVVLTENAIRKKGLK
jgi:hypothetical protein